VRQADSPFCESVPAAERDPEQVAGGKPVIAEPGKVPPFPVRALAPVEVRVVAARALKDFARPRAT